MPGEKIFIWEKKTKEKRANFANSPPSSVASQNAGSALVH